ncbi:hypothetical protein [Corynebacterium glutamicum]|uniref:hypothetical protein n=1 Tax=Corynebacterium glutamicum TaxID=1718 RepID=UPI00155F3529|nr:hypothetical protein [Corynebacterium glutamicum]
MPKNIKYAGTKKNAKPRLMPVSSGFFAMIPVIAPEIPKIKGQITWCKIHGLEEPWKTTKAKIATTIQPREISAVGGHLVFCFDKSLVKSCFSAQPTMTFLLSIP